MNITLLDLLNQNGCRLRKVANTKGGEYAGACPFCGGKDRFRVWSEKDRYWCRQCGKHGDAIQFIRDTKGMGFKDACAYLNIELENYFYKPSEKIKPVVWTPKKTIEPGDIWQEKAMIFLAYTQKALKSDACYDIRKWLYSRGLLPESIEKAGLGWNSKDYYRERSSWGLETAISEKTGKEKKLWLPKGLVIPLVIDKKVIRLRIRREEYDDPS